MKKYLVMLLVAPIVVAASPSYGANGPLRHRGPWPIQNWRDIQPTAKQLRALHEHDITPAEGRKVDQLYWELEGGTPYAQARCDALPIGRDRDLCRAGLGSGASVLPSRPVPRIMAPPR